MARRRRAFSRLAVAGTGFIAKASLSLCWNSLTVAQPGRSTPGPRPSLLRAASDAEALAEAESLAKQAAELRAQAAELRAAESLERRSARARQILGQDGSRPTDRVDSARLGSWLELQGLDTEEAQFRAQRLMEAGGDGAWLSLEVLSSSWFEDRLENELARARQKAAERVQEAQEMSQRVAKEKEQEVVEEREPWKPEQLNDDRGFGTRAASAFVYLFPLFDSLFGVALAADSEQVPVLATVIGALSGPFFLLGQFSFGTQILWLLLTLVANNRRLPRLLRFSIQQAVFLDIAYLILSVIASAEYFAEGGLDDAPAVGYVLPILAFVAVVVTYAAVSAAFGREADSLPFISKYTADWVDGPPPPGFGSGTD